MKKDIILAKRIVEKKPKATRKVFDFSGLEKDLNNSHELIKKHYQNKIDDVQKEYKEIKERIGNLEQKFTEERMVNNKKFADFSNSTPGSHSWTTSVLTILARLNLYSPPSGLTSSIRVKNEKEDK